MRSLAIYLDDHESFFNVIGSAGWLFHYLLLLNTFQVLARHERGYTMVKSNGELDPGQ